MGVGLPFLVVMFLGSVCFGGALLWAWRQRPQRVVGAVAVAVASTYFVWGPLLFIAAALYVVVGSVSSNPWNALLGTGILALGVPVYHYWRLRDGGAGGSVTRPAGPVVVTFTSVERSK